MYTVAVKPATNRTRNAYRHFTTQPTAMAYQAMILRINASIGLSSRPMMPVGLCSGRRKSADRAGESVRALKAEMAIENAMVSENCLYRMPVVPGKKLTG